MVKAIFCVRKIHKMLVVEFRMAGRGFVDRRPPGARRPHKAWDALSSSVPEARIELICNTGIYAHAHMPTQRGNLMVVLTCLCVHVRDVCVFVDG